MHMRGIYLSANLLLHSKVAKARAAQRVQELQASGNQEGPSVPSEELSASCQLKVIRQE